MNAMNIVYNYRAMKQLFQQQDDLNKVQVDDFKARPVIIVGDGISAADAIIYCLEEKIPVLHVFRRTERQLKGTMLSRLSSNVYPEYSKIFDLMLQRTKHPW
jgi:lysine/ornithine N-monooxygenase